MILPALDADEDGSPALKLGAFDADDRSVADDGPSRKLRDTPLTLGGREAFAFLVAVAVIVALLTSVPIAVAVLALGGLILGGALLFRARRS